VLSFEGNSNGLNSGIQISASSCPGIVKKVSLEVLGLEQD
jgi:hypothetical protein